ncbi:MAG: desulfoferrodoxin family protein [Eubacteriaceae bacterium]|nr:desulfoferrodoxin family protein [Eubacteriaceae bacterium]
MRKFLKCMHCGNIVGMIEDKGVPVVCCGDNMTELVPNTVDAAVEKHVPVATVDNNEISVKVGDVEHPMTDDHYIQWIYIETQQGGQKKTLKPGQKPAAQFTLAGGDKAVAAYAYCNLHGLWKKEL